MFEVAATEGLKHYHIHVETRNLGPQTLIWTHLGQKKVSILVRGSDFGGYNQGQRYPHFRASIIEECHCVYMQPQQHASELKQVCPSLFLSHLAATRPHGLGFERGGQLLALRDRVGPRGWHRWWLVISITLVVG